MMQEKRYPRTSLCDEGGMVLVVGLLLVAVLMLLGTTAVMTSTTDIKISTNYKTGNQAFHAAEAGVEEARARLKGVSTAANYAGDPATPPSLMWSAYILTSNAWQTSNDPEYSASYQNYIPTSAPHTQTAITANSLQSLIPYFVKIRHKHEYDAEQNGHSTTTPHYYDNDGNISTHPSVTSPGNLIYWGYGKAATPATALQFTSSAATEFKPVEIITGYGKNGTAFKRIRVEVVRNPGPPIQSPLYSKEDITGNGTFPALQIHGEDNCGAASDKPPTYTLDPSVTDVPVVSLFPATPPSPNHGLVDINVTAYVTELKSSATVTITVDTNGANYGSATNFVTVYSDTSNPYNVQGLKMNNINGFGILLVDGDLELGGGFNWNGLVLCTGTLTFNGGGAGVNIRGAVLANQTVTINGSLDIRYDSCMVDDALDNQSVKIISWREIY